MLKIKLAVVAGFLTLTAIALSGSGRFAASASADVMPEIAKYKTWAKITKEPIKVKIELGALDG